MTDPQHQYPLVLVEWVDSRRPPNDWHVIEDCETDIAPIRSVGWLIGDTAERIIVAPHMGNDPEQCCGDMTIPKCAVKRIANLMSAGESDTKDGEQEEDSICPRTQQKHDRPSSMQDV